MPMIEEFQAMFDDESHWLEVNLWLPWSFGVALLAVVVGGWAWAFMARSRAETRHDRVIAEIRAQRDAKIDAFRGVVADVPKDTLEKIAALAGDVPDLLAALRAGQLTCEQVMRYFIAAAIAAQDACNCLADVMFEEALARAKQLDRDDATNREGALLWGLPFSVKDSLNVRGALTTLGTAKRAERGPVNGATAVLVRLLRKQGAIPFCKTNVPQTLLSFESGNPLWGTTCNAWREDRSAGGSSGGEGALVAGGGSPLGIGTDIGGSVRLPAAFNGITTLKPGSRRVSRQGAVSAVQGQTAVSAALGPLAVGVAGVIAAMRCWTGPDARQLDGRMSGLPLRDDMIRSLANAAKQDDDGNVLLTVAWFETDDWFPACAASRRAVRMAAAALDDVPAVRLVKCKPPSMKELVPLYYALISAGAGPQLNDELYAEDIESFLRPTLFLNALPGSLRRLLAVVLGVAGLKNKARIVEALGAKDAATLFKLVARQAELVDVWLAHMDASEADVLLLPATALPPIRHGGAADLTPSVSYTMLANFLDWPAGVVPITAVTEADLVEAGRHAPADWRAAATATETGSTGLPIAVQLMGRPHSEDTVLGCMHLLEEQMRSQQHAAAIARIHEVAHDWEHTAWPPRSPLWTHVQTKVISQGK